MKKLLPFSILFFILIFSCQIPQTGTSTDESWLSIPDSIQKAVYGPGRIFLGYEIKAADPKYDPKIYPNAYFKDDFWLSASVIKIPPTYYASQNVMYERYIYWTDPISHLWKKKLDSKGVRNTPQAIAVLDTAGNIIGPVTSSTGAYVWTYINDINITNIITCHNVIWNGTSKDFSFGWYIP